MEKDHVKSWNTHPKKWNTHPPRLDPSNDEYITVQKKVALDSLVEFSPPGTQIPPPRANFDLWGVAEKRGKEKEKKKKKRRKKEKKRRLPNRACHSKVFFLECLLGEAWTIFEAIHRQFYENEPPQSQKTSTKLYWMDHLTTLCCRFWRTYWTWNHQGSHQNITNTVLVQQMNHRMTKISIYHSKLNFKKSLILGHTSVRMGIRAPSVAHSLQTRWFSEYVYIADDPFSSNENASSGLRCSDSASRAYDLMVDVLAT